MTLDRGAREWMHGSSGAAEHAGTPGKRSQTDRLSAPAGSERSPSSFSLSTALSGTAWLDGVLGFASAKRAAAPAAPTIRGSVAAVPSSASAVAIPSRTGEPLPEETRTQTESRAGVDLSGVRTFEGPYVDELGAEALTRGSEIHFAPGRADLGSADGAKLLAHELGHVVQQAQGRVTATGEAGGHTINDDSGLESEAEHGIGEGRPPLERADSIPLATTGPIQRNRTHATHYIKDNNINEEGKLLIANKKNIKAHIEKNKGDPAQREKLRGLVSAWNKPPNPHTIVLPPELDETRSQPNTPPQDRGNVTTSTEEGDDEQTPDTSRDINNNSSSLADFLGKPFDESIDSSFSITDNNSYLSTQDESVTTDRSMSFLLADDGQDLPPRRTRDSLLRIPELASNQVAVQIRISEYGKIEGVTIAGRPATDSGARQHDHVSSWGTALVQVEGAVNEQTLQAAHVGMLGVISTMMDQIKAHNDLHELANRLLNNYGRLEPSDVSATIMQDLISQYLVVRNRIPDTTIAYNDEEYEPKATPEKGFYERGATPKMRRLGNDGKGYAESKNVVNKSIRGLIDARRPNTIDVANDELVKLARNMALHLSQIFTGKESEFSASDRREVTDNLLKAIYEDWRLPLKQKELLKKLVDGALALWFSE